VTTTRLAPVPGYPAAGAMAAGQEAASQAARGPLTPDTAPGSPPGWQAQPHSLASNTPRSTAFFRP